MTWEGRSKEVFEVSKAKHFSPLIIEEHSDQFSHKTERKNQIYIPYVFKSKIKPEFFVSFNITPYQKIVKTVLVMKSANEVRA